jgi:hypothetical protein
MRWKAVLCLVAIAAALPSAASSRQGARPPSPDRASVWDLRDLQDSPDALAERARTMMLGGASAAGSQPGSISPVTDLDTDGLPDLVHITGPDLTVTSAAAVESVQYTARRGVDRVPLWTMDVPGQQGVVLDVDTADRGLVLATSQATGVGSVLQIALHLVGVDAGGQRLWERRYEGTVAAAGVLVLDGFPILEEPLGRSDGRQAIHLSLIDAIAAVVADPNPGAAEAVLLDAGSGDLIAQPSASGNGDVRSWSVGDLDGDGNDDVMFTLAQGSRGRAPGQLRAFSSTGSPLWSVASTPAVNWSSHVVAAGDTDGDGTDDVAVDAGAATPTTDRDAPGVFVFSGRDGHVLAARPGDIASAIGDVDNDGLDEVTSLSVGWAPRADGDADFAVSIEAFNGTGRVLSRTTESYPPDPQGRSRDVYWGRNPGTGDVDGDGVAEQWMMLEVDFGDEVMGLSGPFTGLDGRRMWSGLMPVRLGDAISGNGEDVIVVRVEGETGVRLTAQDGATGGVLWERTVDVGAPVEGTTSGNVGAATARVADVDGDGFGDVAVTLPVRTADAAAFNVRHLLLSGVDGHEL